MLLLFMIWNQIQSHMISVFFLAGAELFALKNKKQKFVVLFAPPREDRIVDKIYRSAINEENMQWRFENIVLPLMSIYPACIGHSILLQRSDISPALGFGITSREAGFAPTFVFSRSISSGRETTTGPGVPALAV